MTESDLIIRIQTVKKMREVGKFVKLAIDFLIYTRKNWYWYWHVIIRYSKNIKIYFYS